MGIFDIHSTVNSNKLLKLMVMKKHKLICFGIIILFLQSCASVQYLDKNGNKADGVKTYTANPYLLVYYVAPEAGKDTEAEEGKNEKNPVVAEKIAKTEIIYLPDLKNPLYLKHKNGFGSAKLSIGLQNSILTSYGLDTDSKMPETLTSIAGILPSILGTSAIAGKDKPEDKLFELYEVLLDKDQVITLKPVTIQKHLN